MIFARPIVLWRASIALIVISVLGFETAEYLPNWYLANAAAVAIAALKDGSIMRRFMNIHEVPAGIRGYLTASTVACAALIYGMWWYAAG